MGSVSKFHFVSYVKLGIHFLKYTRVSKASPQLSTDLAV